MKQAILFFLFAVLSASAFGQDMLIVSDSTRLTNRDTNIVNLISTTNNSRIRWEYSVHIISDSISGSNSGTVYLQASNNGYSWYNLQTLTLDGAAQQFVSYEGPLYARRLRVYAITPNATARVTAVRVRAVLRKR